MKNYRLLAITAAAALVMTGAAIAQDREHTQFDEHDQKVAHDWYNQHQDRPPAGFRNQDRLSADEESRFREGAVMDHDLRRKAHSAPPDLVRQLPPPPSNHRYVAVGGHVGLIDNNYNVKAVIHLHDGHDGH